MLGRGKEREGGRGGRRGVRREFMGAWGPNGISCGLEARN